MTRNINVLVPGTFTDKASGTPVEQLVSDQEEVLNHGLVRDASSRQGLRLESGDLLEGAFLDVATTLRAELSIEVGAHEGSYSCRLKQRLPSVRALAFEANPFVYEEYVEKLRPEIEYEHSAIWNTEGEMDFSIPISREGRSIVSANKISSTRARFLGGFEYEKVRVPTRRLDDIASGSEGLRSVAWIDAEGAQREILEGGREFFSRVLAVYIELEREEIWAGQALEASVIESLTNSGLQLVMIDNLARVQYNSVFVRFDSTSEVQAIMWDYLQSLRMMDGIS